MRIDNALWQLHALGDCYVLSEEAKQASKDAAWVLRELLKALDVPFTAEATDLVLALRKVKEVRHG